MDATSLPSLMEGGMDVTRRRALQGALVAPFTALVSPGKPPNASITKGGRKMTFYSTPLLQKHADDYWDDSYESTPLVQNGQAVVVSFKRVWGSTTYSGSGYRVADFFTKTILADFPSWAGFLGCAINVGGTVHIFGVDSDGSNGNHVMHSALNADWSAQPPDVAWAVPSNDRCYNVSVAPDPTGFIAAAEYEAAGIVFLHAPAITGPWTRTGQPYNRDANGNTTFGAACPTIRWVNGYYYLFAATGTPYRTVLSRSPDLSGWEWANPPGSSTVLAADGPGNEGPNASDWDHCEFGGQVLAVYMDGDQATWGRTKTCTWPGTEQQMLESMFP